MTPYLWISLGLVIIVAAVVILTGFRKIPLLGLIAAAVIIGSGLAFHKLELPILGFFPPSSWLVTVLWSLGLGILIALFSVIIIDPIAEKITGVPQDMKPFEKVRGNWKQLLLMLVIAWVLAAFLEETIFRGFLMTTLGNLIGDRGVFASINLFISAIIFGLSHWYQGKSGALRAALLGLIIGDIFIWNSYNLWLPILARGVIEMVTLILVFSKTDLKLKNLFWKEKK